MIPSAIFCLIFAIIMMGVGIGLPVSFISKHLNNRNIINNGELIEGVVVDYKKGSIINNKQYYYVVYKYEVNGEEKYGQTGSNYSLKTAQNMTTVDLYLYNGQICEAEAINNKEVYISIVGIFPFGFGVMCLVFAFKFFKGSKNCANKPLKGGQFATATYVSNYSNTRINGVRYYKIKCRYTNENGETVEEYANGLFSPHERKYLEAKGKIQISYVGNKFAIIEDLNGIEISVFDNKPVVTIEENKNGVVNSNVKHFQCERCGQIVEPSSNGSCPLCGEIIDMKLKSSNQQPKVKCERCNNMVSETAKFCNHCGASMVKNIDNSSAKTKVCSSCGKQVLSSAKFCNYCGNKMD